MITDQINEFAAGLEFLVPVAIEEGLKSIERLLERLPLSRALKKGYHGLRWIFQGGRIFEKRIGFERGVLEWKSSFGSESGIADSCLQYHAKLTDRRRKGIAGLRGAGDTESD